MASAVSIKIRRDAALARINQILNVDTAPGSKDAGIADAILLERIADGVEETEAALADARQAGGLAEAITAATDDELAAYGLSVTAIKAARKAAAEAMAGDAAPEGDE